MGNELGPRTGDSAARIDRNRLAAEGIRHYKIPGLVKRAQAIEDCTDKEYDVRLRDIASFADKVELNFALFHAYQVSNTVLSTQQNRLI